MLVEQATLAQQASGAGKRRWLVEQASRAGFWSRLVEGK